MVISEHATTLWWDVLLLVRWMWLGHSSQLPHSVGNFLFAE